LTAESLDFSIGAEQTPFGCALTIALAEAWEAGEEQRLIVSYATTTESTALQWLSKEQTQDKQQPFLFTQCQVRMRDTALEFPQLTFVFSGYSCALAVPMPGHTRS
jgi:leukotriene-A4 hydrolase